LTPSLTPPPLGRTGSYLYPSPVTGNTARIIFGMEEPGEAEIRVFNANGDLVERISESREAGRQEIVLGVGDYAPGVYYYILRLFYDSGWVDLHMPNKFTREK